MFVRSRHWLLRALSITPEYLRSPEYERGLVSDYRDWQERCPWPFSLCPPANPSHMFALQVPLGRRFRALKLWFTLRLLGAEALREGIRRHCSLAARFAALVLQDERFVVPVEPSLALVCFRLRSGDAANEALVERLNAATSLALVHTKLGGAVVLRFAVGSPLTEEGHVDAAWASIRALADDIL